MQVACIMQKSFDQGSNLIMHKKTHSSKKDYTGADFVKNHFMKVVI